MEAPRIAAALICKNSEATLEACLASIRPHVDHVFIYDTGSTDGTLALLARLNSVTELDVLGDASIEGSVAPQNLKIPLAPITVERGEWRDDFAWAREQSFAMIPDHFSSATPDSYEWALWLDDDDILEGAQNLRHLAATAAPQVDGFVFFYDYARDENGQNVCQLWRERLIRLGRGYHWENAVHEVLAPPEGGQARFVQIPPEVVRYIHNRPPDRYPPERNLKILQAKERKAREAGETLDPRTLAYLGTEHMARGEFPQACPYLQAYIEHPDAAWSDERMQVHHKLAICLRAIGNPMAAVHVEMQAHIERDDWAENAVGLAQSFAMLGNWPRAEREARRALQLGMPNSSLILNPMEFTLLPLMLVADACLQTSRGEEAQAAIAQALALFPTNPMLQAKAQEVEAAVGQQKTVEAILLLREQLVRHDENLKAHHVMEAVPYWLAEHPMIVKARADQREMVKHYTNPAEYRRWYAEEEHESALPDELVASVGDIFPRAERLLEGLQEQEKELGRKPRHLDLGGNDMWLACYLWKNGRIVTDAVELNKPSFERGLKRMKKFKAPGRFVQGDLHDAPKLFQNGKGPAKYDAVSLFEVIEHVPDVEAALKVCEKMLNPGGRIYLTTPNGAYERGHLPAWAHVERKGHLRAITVHDLADIAKARGEVDYLELQHEERVSFIAYTPKKRKSRIVFYAGQGWEPWSPASIEQGGLGGSETALVHVSSRLAQAGHDVTVYSGSSPGLYAGALWRPATAWDPTEACDLLVVSRLAHVFDNPLGAKATALWCHDHSYPGILTEDRAERIDHIVTLSEWERDRYARLYPFAADRLRIIRNGIRLKNMEGVDQYPDADRPFAERAPRCVYSSSADRGLDVMLSMWPQIREQVPDAELHVFYGWNVFDRVAIGNPGLMAYKQRCLALAQEAGGEEGGIFWRGRLGQRELAEEMMQARVWTYPTAFLETSCIGAMEARAAGLALVTSDLGALRETVGSHGVRLAWSSDEDEPRNQQPDYQERFAHHVCSLLKSKDHWTKWHARARRGVDSLDWSNRTKDWEALLPRKTARRSTGRTRVKQAA